jgi:flagellar hook-basal body complex protein FliE
MVSQFVGQTNQQQVAADESVKQLVTGQTDDVQQVVMAVAQADLSFQLFMEIRNKLIDNYNELMRMQF